MPHAKIMVHLVWATKKRDSSIRKEIRSLLTDHIKANASEKGIFIVMINCHNDHSHCLISLANDQNVSKVVQLMKEESAHWINQQRLVAGRVAWQEGYFAVSVGESGVERVKEYIRNQEDHHKKKSFQEEYLELLRFYGFKELV